MCGIAGFIGAKTSSGESSRRTLDHMVDALIRRGPDDRGVWIDHETQAYLGHRRLSIIDLSPAGHQPMLSHSGRYVLVFNGEIYNFETLRKSMDPFGIPWRGHSDTEVLLAGIERWGLEATLQQCVGMFALALWDRQKAELFLARDRFGEKPLYYGWQGTGNERTFLFGSELKALTKHPKFERSINRGALTLLMRHNYVPAPYSIYENIHKLVPGTVLRVSLAKPDPVIEPYWSLVDVAREAAKVKFSGNTEDAIGEVERLTAAAVKQQMVADVPLGAFLSGGIDSSTIVALMQNQSSRPIKTFTIGFSESGFDEAVYAKAVAKHLQTDHQELYVSSAQARDVIPGLGDIYCEPFADSSQIPTFLVSRMAREQVTVALSGDAGDEIFAGYNRYQMTAASWNRISSIPRPLRTLATRLLTSLSPKTWDKLGGRFAAERYRAFGDKIHKGAAVLSERSISSLLLNLASTEHNPADWVIDGSEPPTWLTGNQPNLESLDPIELMMVLDSISYMPDDILTKVDRAAMAVSLETRVPFLDHRLVEFAYTLPIDMKLRNGVTKWPLREILYKHVPRELIDRPKAGFGIPVAEWLRGPLRDWAETLLDETLLRQQGYWNPEIVRATWETHLSGRMNCAPKLWSVLMFQGWLRSVHSPVH
jgi:asparagine synthase (glutamine-hydrolysing)